jgi:hypothetical protein
LTLHEYQQLLEWQTEIKRDGLWLIPSAGPSYGRLIDQAKLLRRFPFPCVMTLPCADPRDAAGLERGLREFAEAGDGARLKERKAAWLALQLDGSFPGKYADLSLHFVFDGVFDQRHGF